MGVRKNGNNYTYSLGNQEWKQDDLNNKMSGTSANAIYYATHPGSGARVSEYPTQPKNPTKDPTPKNDASGTATASNTGSLQLSGSTSGGGNAAMDYAAMIQSMIEQQRAAAQAAYDASRGRLEEAWGNTKGSLDKNLASSLDTLKRNYDYGAGVANKDANKSLREAYINYMMNRKNLNQNLAAAGLSGGATESSMAKLLNNYGNSRNGIKETLANNLAQLANTYQNNTASANQLYNQQYADAMNNYVNQLNSLEQMLANNMMSSYSGSSLSSLAGYAKTLADLQNSMADAAAGYTPTQNSLNVDLVNTTQGYDPGSVTDYAKYQAMVQNMMNQGADAPTIIQQLAQQGVARDIIHKLTGVA